MRKLGLAFGCIDLIVTPEEEHIFLEVNEMASSCGWNRTSQDQSCSAALRRYCSISGLGRRLGSSGMKD
jgi:hypothetical protein